MKTSARKRRRWWGVLFLGAALLLLIAGESVLKPHLHGVGGLCYWLGCLICVTLAAGIAMVDALRVQREMRQEQHDLLTHTLQAVESDRQPRKQPKP